MPENEIPAPEPERHDPYAAFAYPNYRYYIIGWFFAMLGTRIQSVAIGWEMYQRTGEALSLGFVGLAQALPAMILVIPAGYLADRFSRRWLVIYSLAGMTLTSLSLAYLSATQGSVNLMFLFLFLDAVAVTMGRPARSALVPRLVPSHVFPNAVTWNMSLMQISAVVGPAIGGFILIVNLPVTYAISALTSFIFLVFLTRLELPQYTAKSEPVSWQTVLAGMHFVRRKKIILTIISLDMFAVLLGGAVFLLPIYAEDILNVGPTGFGWLRAAPAVGAMLMALLMTHLPPMKHAGRTLLLAVAGFGAATIIFGLSQNFWLSLAMLFLTGAFDNISMVVRQTLIQLLTPDRMRGRVSAVSSVFVTASNELGGFESGLVAHWFGPVVSVVSGGIGTILVVLATGGLSPELLTYGALNDARPDEEEEEEYAAVSEQQSAD
jgi:MFS family permease